MSDGETLDARYRGLDACSPTCASAPRAAWFAGDRPPLGRMQAAAAHGAFLSAADEDGRVTETFEIVYLIGWAPDESQPKPARRGSGVSSLAAALKAKD